VSALVSALTDVLFFDTEEVTGSDPVSLTSKTAGRRLVTEIKVTGRFAFAHYMWSKRGAQDRFPVPARISAGRFSSSMCWAVRVGQPGVWAAVAV
jgi:hypothetical protein